MVDWDLPGREYLEVPSDGKWNWVTPLVSVPRPRKRTRRVGDVTHD